MDQELTKLQPATRGLLFFGLPCIWHKALTDTPCQWHPDSGRTTPTDITHNGDVHWAISIGLSAELWISIPAAASIVALQRRKKERKERMLVCCFVSAKI